jgi:hypothetical protein
VLHEEAGATARRFPNGIRDCNKEGKLLPERRRRDGKGMRLADFVNAPSAKVTQI